MKNPFTMTMREIIDAMMFKKRPGQELTLGWIIAYIFKIWVWFFMIWFLVALILSIL